MENQTRLLEPAVIEAIQQLTRVTGRTSLSSIAFVVQTEVSQVRAIVCALQARGIVGWKEGTEGRHWYLVTGKPQEDVRSPALSSGTR